MTLSISGLYTCTTEIAVPSTVAITMAYWTVDAPDDFFIVLMDYLPGGSFTDLSSANGIDDATITDRMKSVKF